MKGIRGRTDVGSPKVLQGFCIVSTGFIFNIYNNCLKVLKSQDLHFNFASPGSEVIHLEHSGLLGRVHRGAAVSLTWVPVGEEHVEC